MARLAERRSRYGRPVRFIAVTEIVIVPAWRRPDFLQACLERLAAADEGTQRYVISLDRGHTRQVAQVATEFVQRIGPVRASARHRVHPYRGNSYNVLHSYREAIAENPPLIHLVEEDVFVADDYFAWHRGAHALVPDAFAVSGARNQNFADDPQPVDGAVYIAPHYQSVAVSFRPERLAPVMKHAISTYYGNCVKYCRKVFPRTQIPHGNAEQDGLINRVAEATHGKIVYPMAPVAYHAGFVGYHREGEPALVPGKQVRAAAAELLAMDATELNRRAHSYPDHQVVDVRATHTPPDRVVSWPVLP